VQKLLLKTIVYRGGVVRFRIPAHWKEEYGAAGGGTFYEPGDDTGTLRLSTMILRAPTGKSVTAATAAEELADQAQKFGTRVEPLREGIAVVRYDKPATEAGHALVIRFWRIAQALPPSHLRQVVFSYTRLARDFDMPQCREELVLLDCEIRAAEIASVLGTIPGTSK
jgi:hypothetical protein